MRSILYAALVLGTSAGACGDAKQSGVEQSIAKAVHVEDPEKKAREKLEEKERTERQQRLAEQKEKERVRAAEIDAAAVLPATLPANLEAACDATVNAYDTFMKSGPEKDALLWHEGRRKKMAERRAACVTQANITVAACQSVALVAALPSLMELERTEAANQVFQRCADKFGKS
jgi:hypothetical protein